MTADEHQACRDAFLDLERELLLVAERLLSAAGLAHMLGTDNSTERQR